MRSRNLLGALAIALLGAACLVDIPPLATPGTPGTSDAGLDALPTEASPADATPDVVEGGCVAGGFAKPLRAYDANPTAGGDFCNLDGALTKGDGKMAGLDRNGTTNNVSLGGRPETTCVGIEIAPHTLSELVITGATAAQGCDVACNTTDGCLTHEYADVFVAPSSGVWTFLQRVDMTRTLADYVVPIPGTMEELTNVAVCRTDAGSFREDIIVDFIGPRCR
jgi:hypothetical protein